MIVYLVLFQLDIVGLKLLRGFIRSIEINRSYLVGKRKSFDFGDSILFLKFLKFFTNEQNIETMKKECAKLYEQQYVEEKVGLVMKKFVEKKLALFLFFVQIRREISLFSFQVSCRTFVKFCSI